MNENIRLVPYDVYGVILKSEADDIMENFYMVVYEAHDT